MLPLLLAACGGNVVVDGSSGAGTTGAGGAVSTSAGTTGAGGSTTTSCGTGTFFNLVVNGELVPMTSSCFGAGAPALPVPYGQEIHGGASAGGLGIQGCASPAMDSQGITLDVAGAFAPGTFTIGSAQYRQPGSTATVTVSGGTLQVDELDPVGGTIKGSFDQGFPELTEVQGTFVVCRAPDIDAP